jgi:hypothetical protein
VVCIQVALVDKLVGLEEEQVCIQVVCIQVALVDKLVGLEEEGQVCKLEEQVCKQVELVVCTLVALEEEQVCIQEACIQVALVDKLEALVCTLDSLVVSDGTFVPLVEYTLASVPFCHTFYHNLCDNFYTCEQRFFCYTVLLGTAYSCLHRSWIHHHNKLGFPSILEM